MSSFQGAEWSEEDAAQRGEDEDEDEIEAQTDTHHGALGDEAGAEDDGVGGGGDGEHEGAGGGDGEGEDEFGGVDAETDADLEKDGDEEGGGGGVAGEFGEEDDEEDDRTDDEEEGPTCGEEAEEFGEVGAGTGFSKNGAEGDAPAEENEDSPVGGLVDVLPADEVEGAEEDEGADSDDAIEVFDVTEYAAQGFAEDPAGYGEEKDDESSDAIAGE